MHQKLHRQSMKLSNQLLQVNTYPRVDMNPHTLSTPLLSAYKDIISPIWRELEAMVSIVSTNK